MSVTATDREIAKCSLLFSWSVVITKDSEKHDDIDAFCMAWAKISPVWSVGITWHVFRVTPIKDRSVDSTFFFYASMRLPEAQFQLLLLTKQADNTA